MKESLLGKLDILSDRYEEVGVLLSDGEIISNQNRFRDLSREYAELETVVQCFGRFQQVEENLAEARLLLDDNDPELREMGVEEMREGEQQKLRLEQELQQLLLQ